jgi:hypothetical protein
MDFYRAVVEDNIDPIDDSRVRVRIFGLHTQNNENSSEDFNFISSEELPWAEVMGGTDFGLISGIGISTVLRQGTWVWCILDHDDPNKPLIVGTVKGTSKTRAKYAEGEGFNDPDGVYPLDGRLDESDLNRIATGGDLTDAAYDSIQKLINDNLDTVTAVDAVTGADVSQTEPTSTSDLVEYPECAVLETQSGHTIEIDDTIGNERVRVAHKTGSYIEFKPDGSITQKASGTGGINHYIHMSDVQEHIAKGIKTYIEDNIEEIIDGGIKRNVGMDFFKHVGGFFKITADGNLEIDADLKVSGSVEATGALTATGDITSKAQVADSSGNLSSLRAIHDGHTHTNPVDSGGDSQGPTGPAPVDGLTRASDFTWTNTPLGFK